MFAAVKRSDYFPFICPETREPGGCLFASATARLVFRSAHSAQISSLRRWYYTIDFHLFARCGVNVHKIAVLAVCTGKFIA